MKRREYVASGIVAVVWLLAALGCDAPVGTGERRPSTVPDDPTKTAVLKTALSYELAETNTVESNEFTVGVKPTIALKQDSLFFDQKGVQKSITLVNMILGLKKSLSLFYDDKDKTAAITQAGLVRDMLEKAADELGEDDLLVESDLVKKLIANMEAVDPTVTQPCCQVDPDYELNGAPMAGSFDASGVGGSIGTSAPVSSGTISAGKNLGATPGGAQDIGLVRRWIDDGLVPTANNLTVEGLLSEHDLPLEGATCEQFLCVHGALGMMPTLDEGDGTTFVQIGFMSGLRSDTFKRAPLNLVVVVDVSGSMGSGDKMVATREALKRLVDQLTEDDRFGIVKFNSTASVVLESTPATDKALLKAAIDQLAAGGSTNIEAGLTMGYEMAAKFLGEQGRNHRVMLFTDAMPNVGNTEQGGFIQIAQKYADKNIGLTSFGVGIDFRHELILGISQIRGGNYFYLENADKIRKVFDEDFDYLVTPLAYDMKVSLTPGENFEIVAVYGIPNWSKEKQTVTLDVKTVFLSRNKGAIMLRLKYIGPLYF